jgi:hypothetical protein
VTTHSSQGQTAGRVLVHVETERAGEQLVNRRLAYVAVSRGRYDAQIYTDDKRKLPHVLDRDVSHPQNGPNISYRTGMSLETPISVPTPNASIGAPVSTS